MIADDVTPSGFVTSLDINTTPNTYATLWYIIFIEKYKSMRLNITVNNKFYVVLICCSDKKYSVPYRLWSTMVYNSTIMNFPEINWYLVEPIERQPNENDARLFCSFSSSSST